MLGRHRRSSDEPSVFGMLRQVAHIEISRSFESGVVLAQKILVTGEEVVLPKMLCCPGSAVGPHAVVCSIHRSGYSPDVGVVVCYPTVGAIQCLCSLGTSGGKVVDK